MHYNGVVRFTGIVVLACVLAVCLLGASTTAYAQGRGNPMGPPDQPPPPAVPPEEKSEEEEDEKKGDEISSLLSDSDEPWGMPEEFLDELSRTALLYWQRAFKFEATERARSVEYKDGEAGKEKNRAYSYILVTTPGGPDIGESRSLLDKSGKPKKSDVVDEEPFPPAYGWVFLFSEFNQAYFSYRDLGDRFEGFDWVRVIEFRGSLPFTDGKDIRQWEGRVLVDAAKFTPIAIEAQPASQDARMREKFETWSKSFNALGYRSGPKPFGYRCEVEFRFRSLDGLTFPTRLRYDTFRAVSMTRSIPWRASSRTYDDYQFFGVETETQIGGSPR